jgi:hypothetical protein
MDKSKEISDRSRREFLKQVGGALGGLAIAGGFGTNAGAQGAIPSAYKFYRVLNANDGTNSVQSLTAAVMIGGFNTPGKNQTDVIYFHGTTTAQFRTGNPSALFLANINYNGTAPAITNLEVVVAVGDKLQNVVGVDRAQLPIVVGTLGTGSANSLGNYATAIAVEDFGQGAGGSVEVKSSPGVYLFEPLTHTWTKRARFGDTSPDGSRYGGIFGDVVLNDDNSVTLVAATTAQPNLPTVSASRGSRFSGLVGSHALIQVAPPGSEDSFIVLKSGDLLPGTNAIVESFGIIDVVKTDYFVAQVTARRAEIRNAAAAGTGVVRGRLSEVRANQLDGLTLLSASSHLLPEAMIRADAVMLGESIIAPRVGADGETALVIHTPASNPGIGSLDLQRLTVFEANGRRSELAVAGDLADVYQVAALGAPVVSSESKLTYWAEALPDGTTSLFVKDTGTNATATILRSGDTVEGWKITEIHHGYHSAQVDVAGRLAFAAEFLKDPTADPSNPKNIYSSVVVGIPA